MCSAGGDVEYRSRGRGRSRSQRAGAPARLSTAVNKALGHWHETVAGCNVKRCQAPETGGRLAHTVSDGATHSSCSVGRPTQGTGVPGRRRSEQSRPCSVQCAACSSGARKGCCSGLVVLQPAAAQPTACCPRQVVAAITQTRRRAINTLQNSGTYYSRYRGSRHSLFAHNGSPAPHGHPAVRRGRALCHCDHRPEAAAPRAAVRSRGASR